MEYDLIENDGVFTLKNQNTTIGFVRFNELGEVEYIFVNPLFRRRNFASKLLELVRKKTGKRGFRSQWGKRASFTCLFGLIQTR